MNTDDTFNPNSDNKLPPDLEARVAAWVLGEASAFEASELTRLCAEQPELAIFKRRIEAINGLVREAARPHARPLVLSPKRRAKVLAVIGGNATTASDKNRTKVVKRTRFAWRAWVLPMAACLALMGLLAAVIIPTVGSVRETSRHAIERSDARQREQMALIERMEAESGTLVARSGGMADTTVSFGMSMPASDLPSLGSGSGTALGGFGGARAPSAPEPTPTAAPARSFAGSRANGLAEEARGSFVIPRDADGFAPAPAVASPSSQPSSGFDYFAPPPATPPPPAPAEMAAHGRSQYIAGDLDGATETFRVMETLEASNPEAVYFLDRIAKEKTVIGDLKREQTRATMVEEISKAWQRPGVAVGDKSDFADSRRLDAVAAEVRLRGSLADEDSQVLASSMPSASESARRQLGNTIVPSVSFTGVPLSRAIVALSVLGAEFTDAGAKPVDIVLAGPTGPEPVLNITLRNMNLGRILDIITENVGYEYEIEDGLVIVRPQAPAPAPTPVPTPADDLRAETVTAVEAVSTFSLHVSDASFRVAQAALARGVLPDASSIRPEEFYNAFDYGDPAPVAGEPVACRIEQAAHPFLQQRNLVRIAMKVPAAGRSAAQPLRLTVLLDTSGSMEREDRTATVRAALGALASLLGPADRVTLIGFARTPRLLAVNVPGDQAARLIEIAAQTPAEGGTNMELALQLAGEQARAHRLPAAQNRIVILTDGAANLGDADPARLSARVEALRREGIAFDACGVVADGLDDGVLEALTRKGDGRYAIINSPEEADANFARQLAGAFRPAAKDVKVQVRFNPARVARYRLIGFEQHRLRTEDFRDNKIDAAELAAEEAANALYQVEVLPEGEGELGEVFVRFLDPSSGFYVERSWVLGYDARAAAFARATPSLQLAGSAAFLAEKLRGGELAGQVRLHEFAPVVNGLGAAYPGATRVREFIEMFSQTRRMTGE